MMNAWSKFMDELAAYHEAGVEGKRILANEVIDGNVTQSDNLEFGQQTDALYEKYEEGIWEWVVEECDRERMEQTVFEAVMDFADRYRAPHRVFSPDVDPRHFHAVMVWLAAMAWGANFQRHDGRDGFGED